jgi:hypothetical protein
MKSKRHFEKPCAQVPFNEEELLTASSHFDEQTREDFQDTGVRVRYVYTCSLQYMK